MNQRVQEEIKLKTELLKVLFVALLTLSAAVVSLAKDQTGKPIELTFIVLGIFCIFVLSIFVVVLYFEILSIIRKS